MLRLSSETCRDIKTVVALASGIIIDLGSRQALFKHLKFMIESYIGLV